MRKLSYALTFLCVAFVLFLNVLSARRPDWLVFRSTEVLKTRTTIYYGLSRRCELTVTQLPNPSGRGHFEYRDYSCRAFPDSTDNCGDVNKEFCLLWSTADYTSQLAIGYGAVTLVAILFGISTGSRRRRVWKSVTSLILLYAILQIIAFGIVTYLYANDVYPTFDQARPGPAYILNVISWIIGLTLAASVMITGLAAEKGDRWAAGNSYYQPLLD